MFAPSHSWDLDVEALSGIFGSISIVCWVVVFSPQIIENFRRSSAEGLSIEFIVIWLFGDIANIIGAVLQQVLPTMIILAIYYTLADIFLLAQCGYYRNLKPSLISSTPKIVQNHETTPLLRHSQPSSTNNSSSNRNNNHETEGEEGIDHVSPLLSPTETTRPRTRRQSSVPSLRERLSSFGEHLSPALPIHPPTAARRASSHLHSSINNHDQEDIKPLTRSTIKRIIYDLSAVFLVILAGIGGYYLSSTTSHHHDNNTNHPSYIEQSSHLKYNITGQVFGYLCAVLYLGSRVPQLILNYRRKSTEGLNALFFMFACLGNLTFVGSVVAWRPVCRYPNQDIHNTQDIGHGVVEDWCKGSEARQLYGRYILVNLSWLIGSFGTIILDVGVFAQFWIYRSNNGVQLLKNTNENVIDDD